MKLPLLLPLFVLFLSCQGHTKQAAANHNAPPATTHSENDGSSCYRRGMLHLEGIVLKKNIEQATHYFKQACDLGDQKGCQELKKLEKPKQYTLKNPDRPVEDEIFEIMTTIAPIFCNFR